MAKKKATKKRKGTPRTPPYEKYPEWSEARFFSFLRSALRSAWSKYPPKYTVLAKAKRKSQSENKRLKWEFQCNKCKHWYPQKEVSVDHEVPAGTLRTFEDLPEFCRKLFCSEEELQVLCSTCHSEKTRQEREDNKKEIK